MSKKIICTNPEGNCLLGNCDQCSWGKEVASPVAMIEKMQQERKQPTKAKHPVNLGGKFTVVEKHCMFATSKKIWITRVEYNKPWTIVFWNDGSITRCQCATGDTYTKEAGLAICILKKLANNEDVVATLQHWCGEEDKLNLTDVRRKLRK